MKITMHDPLEVEALGDSLGVPVDTVIGADGTVYAGDIAFGASDRHRAIVELAHR
jgi:hypothetical protein